MDISDTSKIEARLGRIARALEIMTGTPSIQIPEWDGADKFIWDSKIKTFRPVMASGMTPPVSMLVGVSEQIESVTQNTLQFAKGYPANNVLLWGARGMGKSACVKAVHDSVRHEHKLPLILIEIGRDDLTDIQLILEKLQEEESWRFLLFCDDMSFEKGDDTYKSLKTVLDGGIGARPPNVVFYATSNRRHLMLNEGDETGHLQILWVGFHPCTQEQYLEMIDRYIDVFDLPVDNNEAHDKALKWEKQRGSRSGRVAWHFILDLAGQHGVRIY